MTFCSICLEEELNNSIVIAYEADYYYMHVQKDHVTGHTARCETHKILGHINKNNTKWDNTKWVKISKKEYETLLVLKM